jgi:hypothetical protein
VRGVSCLIYSAQSDISSTLAGATREATNLAGFARCAALPWPCWKSEVRDGSLIGSAIWGSEVYSRSEMSAWPATKVRRPADVGTLFGGRSCGDWWALDKVWVPAPVESTEIAANGNGERGVRASRQRDRAPPDHLVALISITRPG